MLGTDVPPAAVESFRLNTISGPTPVSKGAVVVIEYSSSPPALNTWQLFVAHTALYLVSTDVSRAGPCWTWLRQYANLSVDANLENS